MKILYGVPGEGMGHATRTKVIVSHLLEKGHDVKMVSSDRAFTFLNSAFPNRVYEIEGLHFAFKKGKVSKSGTFVLNLKNLPKTLIKNFEQYLFLDEHFRPELVISDFESFSYFFAKTHGIPFISIDNMQVMDRCKLDIEIEDDEKSNYRLAKNIVKAKVPGAAQYFISSFFEAEISKENTQLVPPIIRTSIQEAKVERGNHILVYQSTGAGRKLIDILKKLSNERFIVYGYNIEEEHENVQLKKFSETEFIQYFATSKAVIANGGFSFISEAIYLKKPIYSFPLEGQFEQYMNAAYIEKCGYGRHFNKMKEDYLKAFLYDLAFFQNKLNAYQQNGNEVLFEKIDTYLSEFEKSIS
ncbi:MAG: MJ1255/VC2487 family glycosyltransferase [Bacteroidia bacterium]